MIKGVVTYLSTDNDKSESVDFMFPTWDSFESGIKAMNNRVYNGELIHYNMTGVDDCGNYRSSSFNRMK